MASSTNNAFNVLMAHRGPASITGAPATGIASILIVEVDNGTGTAPRDSSQSASVPAVLAVAAVASPPLGFLEKLDCTVILKNCNAGGMTPVPFWPQSRMMRAAVVAMMWLLQNPFR